MWTRPIFWRLSVADPKAPEMPEGWFPHYDHFRRANAAGGVAVQYRAEQLHVSDVYVDPQNPRGFSIPLVILKAALSAHGLHVVTAADVKVLEASSDAPESELRLLLSMPGVPTWETEHAEAELARRGVKP